MRPLECRPSGAYLRPRSVAAAVAPVIYAGRASKPGERRAEAKKMLSPRERPAAVVAQQNKHADVARVGQLLAWAER